MIYSGVWLSVAPPGKADVYTSHLPITQHFQHLQPIMANRGYDVVVDVDAEVSKWQLPIFTRIVSNRHVQGDLGHTDLQEDLEFHPSS